MKGGSWGEVLGLAMQHGYRELSGGYGQRMTDDIARARPSIGQLGSGQSGRVTKRPADQAMAWTVCRILPNQRAGYRRFN